MFDWLNTGLGTIGALGVIITLVSWPNSRETNKILAKQADYLKEMKEGTQTLLKEMDDSTKTLLAQMEDNAVTRYNTVMDKLEGRP
jgi:hypothetical protein